MTTAQKLKQELLQAIDSLPHYRLQEVLDFVEFLQWRNLPSVATDIQPNGELDPEKDPLLHYIGGASHGSLAQSIDKELYD